MPAPDATSAAGPVRAPAGRFEIPFAALAAAAGFCALFVLPVAGALGLPLAAVPVVRLAHRRGLVAGLLGCALAAAVILGLGWATGGASSGLVMAFLAAGVTMLPTSTVGFLRAGADPSRCYLGLCLAGGAFLAASFAASAGSPGPSVAAEVASSFDTLIPAAIESYSRSGADAEAVARMRVTLESGREFARKYLWGIFGALWVLGGAIAFYAGAASARPTPTAEAARFEALRVPAQAAGLFVATGAAFGLLQGEGRRVAGNLLLPLTALFFVAGLSIICHFFRRWLRARILRAGLYALAAYFPINVGVALLGLFDWYVDFRRRGGEGTERT
jgi:Predicted membrane protein (DUF2232)